MECWEALGPPTGESTSCTIKRLCIDVALLQETPLSGTEFKCMSKLWVGEMVASPLTVEVQGLFIKQLPYVLKYLTDDDIDHNVTACIEVYTTRNLLLQINMPLTLQTLIFFKLYWPMGFLQPIAYTYNRRF